MRVCLSPNMDLWSIGSKIAETARDVLTEEQADEQESFMDAAQSPGGAMVEAALLDEALRDLEQMTKLCEKQKAELASVRRQEDDAQMEVRAELSQIKARLRRSEADKDAAEKKFQEELQLSRAEREAEVAQLRGEVARLQRLAEASQGARGDETNLRVQVAALTAQLASERDDTSEERKQEVAALQEKDAELARARETVAALQREAASAAERELAASRQLAATREKSDLLRAHLLEREEELEQMAQTIAASKEAAAELQAQLAAAREQGRSAEELARLVEEKDRHIARVEKALANLDEAVGQLSEDHRGELQRKEKLLRERFFDEFAAKLALREKELSGVSAALAAKNEALELELGRLMSAIVEKEKKVEMLLNEINPLREALTEAMKKLTDAVDKDQFAVDKRLVANLVFAYFTNDKGKSNEVLSLMLRILDVPKERREQIYGRLGGGWFGGRRFTEDDGPAGSGGGGGGGGGGAAATMEEGGTNKSLGDMWIEYLLKEAEKGSAPGEPNK